MKTLLALLLLIPSLSWGNKLHKLLNSNYEIIDTHYIEESERVFYILYNKNESDKLYHCMVNDGGSVKWCDSVK